jgi:hypothetical protein
MPQRDVLRRVLMRCSPWWPISDHRKSRVFWLVGGLREIELALRLIEACCRADN